jgi:hypothetical protein
MENFLEKYCGKFSVWENFPPHITIHVHLIFLDLIALILSGEEYDAARPVDLFSLSSYSPSNCVLAHNGTG